MNRSVLARAWIHRGAAGSISLNLSGEAFAILVTIILARSLGVGSYGTYTFVTTLVLLIAFPLTTGVPTVLVREISKFVATARWDLARGVFNASTLGGALLSALAAGVAYFGAPLLTRDGDGVELLRLSAFLIPPLTLSLLTGSMIRAYDHPILGQLPRFIQNAAFACLAVAAWVTTGLNATTAVTLYIVSACISLAVGIILVARLSPVEMLQQQPSYEVRNWASGAVAFALLAGAQVLFGRVDLIMLGTLAGDEEVGLYRIASQGGAAVALGVTAVSQFLRPQVARQYHTNQVEELLRLTRRWSLLVTIGATVLGLTILVAGRPLIAMLFGPSYLPAYPALVILAVGQWISAVLFSITLVLNMAGFERLTVLVMSAALALNVALNFLLIPMYGIEGSALATSFSLTIANVTLYILSRRKIGFDLLSIRRRAA